MQQDMFPQLHADDDRSVISMPWPMLQEPVLNPDVLPKENNWGKSSQMIANLPTKIL